MYYHASRIAHWTQNKDVNYYASHNLVAITLFPLAEYICLHLYLLPGHDFYFQLVQWTAFTASLTAISLIVTYFTASRGALRFSLCFAATLPIAVLQSMTTQNDLLAGTWSVIAVALLFESNRSASKWLALGVVAGLGAMTKPIFVFYTWPFFMYILCQYAFRAPRKALIAAVVIGVLSVPFFTFTLARNLDMHQSFFGNSSNGLQHLYSWRVFVSTFVKHIAMNLGFLSPGDMFNTTLMKLMNQIHDVIGRPLNDGATDANVFKFSRLNQDEDLSANFLHGWLILFTPLVFFFRRTETKWLLYALCTFLGFLTACATIPYQIFGSRLQMPFMLMMTPLIGAIWATRVPRIIPVLSVVFLLFSVSYVFLSNARPMVSTRWFFNEVFPSISQSLNLRIDLKRATHIKKKSIFSMSREEMLWRELYPSMDSLFNEVYRLAPRNVGLVFTNEAAWNYAYQQSLPKGASFEHVLIKNNSKRLENNTFVPDVIVSDNRQPDDSLLCHSFVYKLHWKGSGGSIYVLPEVRRVALE